MNAHTYMYMSILCSEGTCSSDLDFAGRDHEHALEDFGEVSEVEGVVGFGRSGQQLCGDGVVHGSGGVHQLRDLHVHTHTFSDTYRKYPCTASSEDGYI